MDEVPQIITKDLAKAWDALEERLGKAEKEAERGLKEGLEAWYQESGLDAILHRSDKDYERAYMRACMRACVCVVWVVVVGRPSINRVSSPTHPQPTTADSAFAASTASTAASAAAGGGGAPGGGVPQSASAKKRRGEGSWPVRPILFTSAPRGPVPFDVPLIVTPLVPLPDHALAAVHIEDLAALRRTGDGEKGLERVCDRVQAMRASALSEPLQEWWVGGGNVIDDAVMDVARAFFCVRLTPMIHPQTPQPPTPGSARRQSTRRSRRRW